MAVAGAGAMHGWLARAAEAGIATQMIPHKGKTREAFDAELDAALRAAEAAQDFRPVSSGTRFFRLKPTRNTSVAMPTRATAAPMPTA